MFGSNKDTQQLQSQEFRKCTCRNVTGPNETILTHRWMETFSTQKISMGHTPSENGVWNGYKHPCSTCIWYLVTSLPTAERDSEGLLWSRISHTWMKVSIEQLASKFGSNRCQLRSLTTRVCERSVCVWTKSPPDCHDSISTRWLLWNQNA